MSDEDLNMDDWAASLDDDAGLNDDWAAALEEQATGENTPVAAETDADTSTDLTLDDDFLTEDDIQKAPLEYLTDESVQFDPDNPNLEVIMDIPVTISMEVGSTEIAIRNLLQLNQGSVIELDRLAGEPLDVRVNGTLIAHGEVVMVNEKFGIRLTDVVSPSERIKRLR